MEGLRYEGVSCEATSMGEAAPPWDFQVPMRALGKAPEERTQQTRRGPSWEGQEWRSAPPGFLSALLGGGCQRGNSLAAPALRTV